MARNAESPLADKSALGASPTKEADPQDITTIMEAVEGLLDGATHRTIPTGAP